MRRFVFILWALYFTRNAFSSRQGLHSVFCSILLKNKESTRGSTYRLEQTCALRNIFTILKERTYRVKSTELIDPFSLFLSIQPEE